MRHLNLGNSTGAMMNSEIFEGFFLENDSGFLFDDEGSLLKYLIYKI